jgi:hypothetical protein
MELRITLFSLEGYFYCRFLPRVQALGIVNCLPDPSLITKPAKIADMICISSRGDCEEDNNGGTPTPWNPESAPNFTFNPGVLPCNL